MVQKNPLAREPLPFVAVDLFAGGGGLSLGLKQAGFLVSAAVEYDKHASATYRANHPETVLYNKDIRQVTGKELIATSPTGCIDLIAACPPCQGFSSLTSKYKQQDERDTLINEFARLIREVRPSTLMMENVPGLAKKGAHLFNPVIAEFESMGYHISFKVVNVADYGVPQQRRRLVVLGSRLSKIEIPQPTHCENPERGLYPWLTVRDAIAKQPIPITLADTRTIGGPQKVEWNVVRNLAPQNIARLKVTTAGASRTELPKELRPICHQENGGFSNVYGRMSWDKPAPTITGGCTTLSKGRFGHPTALRTISVREAALLQTFPNSYIFETDLMDRACIIIGNALPPIFAKKMALACAKNIKEN
ncbi:MAG: hypothetical protein RIR79_518 [Pseudomonadota bacterium]|jgi:DNA (cytosine-5)-methyltransferase 1